MLCTLLLWSFFFDNFCSRVFDQSVWGEKVHTVDCFSFLKLPFLMFHIYKSAALYIFLLQGQPVELSSPAFDATIFYPCCHDGCVRNTGVLPVIVIAVIFTCRHPYSPLLPVAVDDHILSCCW